MKSQEDQRFDEAPTTTGIKTAGYCRRTVDYRVRTTVPWSQKLCAVGRTTGCFNRAITKRCTANRVSFNFLHLLVFAAAVMVS